MNQNICPHCGEVHPVGTRFCPKTGQAIPVSQTCPKCGAPVEAGWLVCGHCGKRLSAGIVGLGAPEIKLFGLLIGVMVLIAAFAGGYWLLNKTPSETSTPEQETHTESVHETETENLAPSLSVQETETINLAPSAEYDSSKWIPVVSEEFSGYMDPMGAIQLDISSLGHYIKLNPFSEGLAAVFLDGKGGYIDSKGEFVIAPEYIEVYDFSEGLAKVCIGPREEMGCGFVDKTGKLVIEPQGRQFFVGDYFSNGYVQIFYGNVRNDLHKGHDFMDKSGNFLFGEKKLFAARPFSEGLAAVDLYDDEYPKWGYINTSGRMVIEPTYDYTQGFHEGRAAIKVYLGKPVECRGDTRGTVYLWGYIDTSGKMVIPVQYYRADDFSNGLARVQGCDYEDDSYTFIDTQGEIVIPPLEMFGGGAFENGYLLVLQSDQLFIMDTQGNEISIPAWLGTETFFYADVLSTYTFNDEFEPTKREWINLKTGKVIYVINYEP